MEVRLPGADANPYLALAAALAAIVHGITDEPELLPPCTGDAYQADRALPVPRDLADAVSDFDGSKTALAAFGDSVVRHYTRAAQVEIDEHRRRVTDVELQRGSTVLDLIPSSSCPLGPDKAPALDRTPG